MNLLYIEAHLQRDIHSSISLQNDTFRFTELFKNKVDGWFKLLTQQEGEFYNVPIIDDENEEEIKKITKLLEVSIYDLGF